jgi:hypothetical protein
MSVGPMSSVVTSGGTKMQLNTTIFTLYLAASAYTSAGPGCAPSLANLLS